MKKTAFLFLTTFYISTNAQEIPPPPIVRSTHATSNGLKINSRKSTLIEKQIFNLEKFKSLNIQKVVLKDISDNSTENILEIMTEYETFDNISKRTLTIEKPELLKLIQALETLDLKENETKTNPETKYKFVTVSNIEFGGVYNNESNNWINYIKLPFSYGQNLNEFNKNELKELIKLLKNAEKEL